jgi:phospholipase C
MLPRKWKLTTALYTSMLITSMCIFSANGDSQSLESVIQNDVNALETQINAAIQNDINATDINSVVGNIIASAAKNDPAAAIPTKTPIKHLVVIFGENRSFDHYFATYPKAQNNPGERPFTASPLTPDVNNLLTPLDPNNGFVKLKGLNLLANNPNGPDGTGALINGVNASNPFRVAPTNAWTDGNNHGYSAEQAAYDNGKMDLFPAHTGDAGSIGNACNPGTGAGCISINQAMTMAYFDGNTVTGMWNLAQHFAMSDNMFTTMFGPSTPGAINLISGQTNFITAATPAVAEAALIFPSDGQGNFTLNGDVDPFGDVCSSKSENAQLGGQNIGDLMNARKITWGWFSGGFNLNLTNVNGSKGCGRSTQLFANPNITSGDYVPHHQPFQLFASTANPMHMRPTSTATIGQTDPANHEYDIQDFFSALANGNLPAVNFLKAPSAQDSHPGNSDPIDEQVFISNVINALEQSPDWSSTAVVITYDDSDGWYDHQMPPIVNISQSIVAGIPGLEASAGADFLNGTEVLNSTNTKVLSGGCLSSPFQQDRPSGMLNGVEGLPVQGRCGYGTRVPFLVISPWAKTNFVDHTLLDQSSVSRFIEDNWLQSQRLGGPNSSFDSIAGSIEKMFDFSLPIGLAPKVFLQPTTGAIVPTPPANSNAQAQAAAQVE